jgi:protein polybromo-1
VYCRKRLRVLYNSILNWTNTDNIQPIGVFMEKPDKKSYPDYYDIITEPIDMNCIDSKINRNVYRSVCTAVDRVDFFVTAYSVT